jgi:hypothetical protein
LSENGLQELIIKVDLVVKSSDPTDQCTMYTVTGWVLMRTGIKMQINIGRLKVNLMAHSHNFPPAFYCTQPASYWFHPCRWR